MVKGIGPLTKPYDLTGINTKTQNPLKIIYLTKQELGIILKLAFKEKRNWMPPKSCEAVHASAGSKDESAPRPCVGEISLLARLDLRPTDQAWRRFAAFCFVRPHLTKPGGSGMLGAKGVRHERRDNCCSSLEPRGAHRVLLRPHEAGTHVLLRGAGG